MWVYPSLKETLKMVFLKLYLFLEQVVYVHFYRIFPDLIINNLQKQIKVFLKIFLNNSLKTFLVIKQVFILFYNPRGTLP